MKITFGFLMFLIFPILSLANITEHREYKLQAILEVKKITPDVILPNGVWLSNVYNDKSILQQNRNQETILRIYSSGLIEYYSFDTKMMKKKVDFLIYNYEIETNKISITNDSTSQDFFIGKQNDSTLEFYKEKEKVNLILSFRKVVINSEDDVKYFSGKDYPFNLYPLFDWRKYIRGSIHSLNGVWQLKLIENSLNPVDKFEFKKNEYWDIRGVPGTDELGSLVNYKDEDIHKNGLDSILNLYTIACAEDDMMMQISSKKRKTGTLLVSDNVLKYMPYTDNKNRDIPNFRGKLIYYFVRLKITNNINHDSAFEKNEKMIYYKKIAVNNQAWNKVFNALVTIGAFAQSSENLNPTKYRTCSRCGGSGKLSCPNVDNGISCHICGGSGQIPD